MPMGTRDRGTFTGKNAIASEKSVNNAVIGVNSGIVEINIRGCARSLTAETPCLQRRQKREIACPKFLRSTLKLNGIFIKRRLTSIYKVSINQHERSRGSQHRLSIVNNFSFIVHHTSLDDSIDTFNSFPQTFEIFM